MSTPTGNMPCFAHQEVGPEVDNEHSRRKDGDATHPSGGVTTLPRTADHPLVPSVPMLEIPERALALSPSGNVTRESSVPNLEPATPALMPPLTPGMEDLSLPITTAPGASSLPSTSGVYPQPLGVYSPPSRVYSPSFTLFAGGATPAELENGLVMEGERERCEVKLKALKNINTPSLALLPVVAAAVYSGTVADPMILGTSAMFLLLAVVFSSSPGTSFRDAGPFLSSQVAISSVTFIVGFSLLQTSLLWILALSIALKIITCVCAFIISGVAGFFLMSPLFNRR